MLARRLTVLAGLCTTVLASQALGQGASFTVLGDLVNGQGSSSGLGVSADGTTVVGVASSNLGDQAFRWTSEGGMEGLGLPDFFGPDFNGLYTCATAASEDGSVITGYECESENGNLKAWRWTVDGMVELLPGEFQYSAGRAISLDGNVIAGESYVNYAHAFRWDIDSVEEVPLDESGVQMLAWGISHDGNAIAGSYGAFPSNTFRWTSENGVEVLGDIPDGLGDNGANAISGDGNTVVGFAADHENFQDRFQAMRWTPQTGMVGIGRLPGKHLASAFGVNGDGSTIVGYGFNSGAGGSERAFIWTKRKGMRDLGQVLQSQGVDLGVWFPLIGYAVSADGRTIVGNARDNAFHTRAFVAHINCDSDFDNSGFVDTDDFDAFVHAFEIGTDDADFDGSGFVDTDDFDAFVHAFEEGC